MRRLGRDAQHYVDGIAGMIWEARNKNPRGQEWVFMPPGFASYLFGLWPEGRIRPEPSPKGRLRRLIVGPPIDGIPVAAFLEVVLDEFDRMPPKSQMKTAIKRCLAMSPAEIRSRIAVHSLTKALGPPRSANRMVLMSMSPASPVNP